MDVGEIIKSLGGHPRSDESENLELLANEILILRQKLSDADDAEGRAERRLGKEIASREQAETRARIVEDALSTIAFKIASAKREALAKGAPIRSLEDNPVALHIEPIGGDRTVIRDGEING